MLVGTIKWFNETKGFGFISPDGLREDVYVHVSEVRASGQGELAFGRRVRFDLASSHDGRPSAVNVALI